VGVVQRLALLRQGVAFTGDVSKDVPAFLCHHGCPRTASHSSQVANEAERIARLFGVDEGLASMAGWLHDVSAVVPPAERAEAARELGLEVLPEEEAHPMIVHQKLSMVLARELFGVSDPGVLSAVGCHTTLKRDASPLDKVVFVADKIAWDQQGVPPYLEAILEALDRSLDEAALVYLRWMRERRHELKVVHPWLRDAYEALSGSPWEP
jgi:predicted HD superfamily hydrolase involved in NAD metabolism